MNNSSKKLSRLIKIALLGAIAALFMFVEVPLVPAFPWLKLDISELPVLIGAFAFGPISGAVIEGVKLVLHILLKGSSTGFVGELANFIVGISFVMPAAFIYHRNKSKKTAIIGMIVGSLSMEVFAALSNVYILLPAFGMSGQVDMAKYVVYGLIPFNGVKAILISVITFLVYKRISTAIFKVDTGFESKKKLNNEM